jgi:diguanylate cyclase (GGDEF)-like protein
LTLTGPPRQISRGEDEKHAGVDTDQAPNARWKAYGASVGLVALAAASRVWPLHGLGSSLAWLTFYPAVTLAAIYGGLPAGLLASGLACVCVVFLWSRFAPGPFIRTGADWVGLLVFVGNSGLISGVAHALRRSQSRVESLRTLVNAMDEGFCVIEMIRDASGRPVDYRFLETNAAFRAQTQLADANHKTRRQMVPDHDDHWFETYDGVARTGGSIRFEEAAAKKRHYDVFAFRIGGKGSRRVGILFKDISEQKATEAKLLQSARFDGLTGLANREMFQDYLAKALARASRSGLPLGLLFLDLDDFKAINDTFGHMAGDELLRSVADRLSRCLRAGDLISRLGGDEFTIIAEDCPPNHLAGLAEKVIDVLEAPFDLAGQAARISTSVGAVYYPGSASDGASLVQRADEAMYAAKKAGKNRYRFWTPEDAGQR